MVVIENEECLIILGEVAKTCSLSWLLIGDSVIRDATDIEKAACYVLFLKYILNASLLKAVYIMFNIGCYQLNNKRSES